MTNVYRKDTFTRILAILGAVLVWAPILLPIAFSAIGLIASGIFHIDYLMPAELFPSALAGGLLLFWAALRARSRQKWIGWGLGASVVLLVGGQAIAVAAGFASGETEPAGWILALVIACMALYSLAVITLGIVGVMLMRDLFTRADDSVSQGEIRQ
jgi:hypothetical protein